MIDYSRNYPQPNQATDTSGSTGVVALITATHVFVANAGDSRAILINARMRHGGGVGRGYVGVEEVTVTPMSYDHTASDPQERERIASAGGTPFEVYCKGQDGTVARVRNTFNGIITRRSVNTLLRIFKPSRCWRNC